MRSPHRHLSIVDGNESPNADEPHAPARELRHADHLAAFVGTCFGLSRAPHRGRTLMCADVPVRPLMAEAYALVEPFAVAQGVCLVVDCEHPLAVIRGERTALLWALMNLACSAVRRSRRGGRVTLSSIVERNTVDLRVQDMGAGLLSARHDSRFAPATKVQTADAVETARDLTELMGGVLLIRPFADGGSQFAMRFRAALRPAVSKQLRPPLAA